MLWGASQIVAQDIVHELFCCGFPDFPIFSSWFYKRPNTMTDQILTLKEVAAYLKLADKTAYKLAAEGKLPGFKVGGSWRFKRDDIERWIEERKITDSGKGHS